MNILEAVANVLTPRQQAMHNFVVKSNDDAKKNSEISSVHIQHGLQKDRWGKSTKFHPVIQAKKGETGKQWVSRASGKGSTREAKLGAISGAIGGGIGTTVIGLVNDAGGYTPALAAGGATILGAAGGIGSKIGSKIKHHQMGKALVKSGKIKGLVKEK